MISLAFFESESEAINAANALEKLGGRARRLLAEAIEHQGIIRKNVSVAAKNLENEGFVFIAELDDHFDKSVEIKPTLSGEEAMNTHDYLNQKQHY